MGKFFGAVLLLGLATKFVVAQDPTKTEPAHYKLAFENDKVQVVDIHYGPHEKSAMHEHLSGLSFTSPLDTLSSPIRMAM
jgi:hypothetical protein